MFILPAIPKTTEVPFTQVLEDCCTSVALFCSVPGLQRCNGSGVCEYLFFTHFESACGSLCCVAAQNLIGNNSHLLHRKCEMGASVHNFDLLQQFSAFRFSLNKSSASYPLMREVSVKSPWEITVWDSFSRPRTNIPSIKYEINSKKNLACSLLIEEWSIRLIGRGSYWSLTAFNISSFTSVWK